MSSRLQRPRRLSHLVREDAKTYIHRLQARGQQTLQEAETLATECRNRLRQETEIARLEIEAQKHERLSKAAPPEEHHASTTTDRISRDRAIEHLAIQLDDQARAEVVRGLEPEWDRVTALEEASREMYALSDELARAHERSGHLAPWDHLALKAARVLGDLPPSEEADTHLLRGAEVEALFAERLGVSRSEYYKRYRPLLRTHHLGEMLGASHVRRRRSGLGPRVSGKRWLQEEVEGLIRYISRPVTDMRC